MKIPKIYLASHSGKNKRKLIEELFEKDKVIEDKDKVIEDKDKAIEKLEKELKKYKNANTPSSASKHLKADTLGLKAKKGAKRGAPKGHKGSTFVWPEIDEIINLFVYKCAQCNSKNIKPTGYVKEKKVICLIKAKTVVKMYHLQESRCNDCNTLTLASHKDIPEKGIYDKNIQALVNYFKFRARVTFDPIVDIMNNIFNVPMTRPTALTITRRTSDKLKPHYNQLEKDINKLNVVHSDETSHSVNGTNHWIWVFCDSLFSLFKIQKERGGDIVEKTLGKDFKGKIVTDGWSTYEVYSKKHKIIHQRCWDHLKREIEYECKINHPDLYKWVCDIYQMVRKGKKYKQEKRRKDMYKKCKAELAMLINHMNTHTNLRKLANKIKNGGNKWFYCIIYPELPMNNNEAERSIRPFVVMRKIIGCLRSEIGMKNYEIMMSLISTWQKQGKNTFYTLQTLL